MESHMIIYSWNMLYRNKRPAEAYAFVQNADFDVFCLQEVPDALLERFKADFPFVAYRQDVEKIFSEGEATTRMWNVILSRHKIVKTGEIPFPDYGHLLTLRSRFSLWLMRPLGFGGLRNRGGLFADIEVSGIPMRVFNLHLILARPAWRLREFEQAMAERDASLPTIVCGDFNTLEKPHIAPLNWIMGAPLSSSLRYKAERTEIEARFIEHELANPLRGKRTHALSRSQLDHILLSPQFEVTQAEVIPDRPGSDHHPIRALVSWSSEGVPTTPEQI